MRSLKFYKYLAFAMLLINIAIVAFFLMSKPKGPRPNSLKKGPPKLELNTEQLEQFKVLANTHKDEMKTLKKQQKNVLATYFQAFSKTDIVVQDLTEFLELEKRKITSTANHFKDVKGLLNTEQLKNYPEFINKAVEIILTGDYNPHPSK